MAPAPAPSLKLKTARSLKWNLIDRVGSQVLYAVTGIVLARELSQQEFGLVGAVLVFQAFASLLVEGGFSSALMQRKAPTRLDYSTVLWFNTLVSAVLYAALWLLAPWLAGVFDGNAAIIPLSRVMFLSIIINGLGIVQTNRFMKQMHVRPVAMANAAGLAAGGGVGIWLAVSGYGTWAIVWQTLAMATVRTALLWIMSRWTPLWRFSWHRLRGFFSVGAGMLATSFLNTLFLNIYAFFIGNRVSLAALGVYTQSDKWSKMPTASLGQVLTSTFLPVLSSVQDHRLRFKVICRKMNRLTAYVTLPLMLGLCITATPLFHVLFGPKWDASIPLFQLLLVRGIFTIFIGLYTNFLLALAHARMIMYMEVVRDTVALVALGACLPFLNRSTPGNPFWGVELMIWGQLAATIVAWLVMLWATRRLCRLSPRSLIGGLLPYLGQCAVIGAIMWAIGTAVPNPWLCLALQGTVGLALYLGVNRLLGSKIQRDALAYLRGKL